MRLSVEVKAVSNSLTTKPLKWTTIVPGVGLAAGPGSAGACLLLLLLAPTGGDASGAVTNPPCTGFCGIGAPGAWAKATPVNPAVPSVATLASRNLRIRSSSLHRPSRRALRALPRGTFDAVPITTDASHSGGAAEPGAQYEMTARNPATGIKRFSWQLRNTVASGQQATMPERRSRPRRGRSAPAGAGCWCQ